MFYAEMSFHYHAVVIRNIATNVIISKQAGAYRLLGKEAFIPSLQKTDNVRPLYGHFPA